MVRTIVTGAAAQARSGSGAHISTISRRGRNRRDRGAALRNAVSGALDHAASRQFQGIEQLEGRLLLTQAPVIRFSFSVPPDAGDLVTNTGVLGAPYNGTFQPSGAGGPTRTTRNNTVGDTSGTQAISLNGTNQVIETATELQPILGRTGSLTAWI